MKNIFQSQVRIKNYMKKNKFKQLNKETTIIYIIKRNGEIREVLIDIDDFDRVINSSWCLGKGKYAQSIINGSKVYLHHFLIGKPASGMETDHRDRNTLNNKKDNLSHVSIRQNRINRKITNKHGFPGIYYLPDMQKGFIKHHHYFKPWQVRIRIKDLNSPYKNGGVGTRLIHVGMFKTIEEAIEARKKAELKYFGNIFHNSVEDIYNK